VTAKNVWALVFLSAIVILVPYSGSAAKCFTIQVGALPTETEGKQLANSFIAKGYSPVFVKHIAPHYKVFVGKFDYHMDAFVWKKLLRAGDCPDAFEHSFDAAQVADVQSPNRTPFPRLRSLPYDSIISVTDHQIDQSSPPVSTIRSLIEAKKTDEARAALIQEIDSRPTTDPIRGWATLALGRLSLRADEQANAQHLLSQVADLSVAARRQDVRDALFALSWIDHDQRDQVKAYRGFGDLAEISAHAQTRARCRVEQIGIMFEMAQSGIGTLEEVRTACGQFLESTAPEFRNYRATVELMSLETYFFDGDYQKLIDLGKQFIAKYPDIKREYGAARQWIAIGFAYLDDYENAIGWFLRVLDTNFDPQKDYFRGQNFHDFTSRWLKYIWSLPPY
jgi:hypothetical protein